MADELGKKLKWKDFYENVLRDREFCNTTCQCFTRCPFSVQTKITEKQPCRVKELDNETQRRFVRLFVFGDDGLYDEAISTLFMISQKVDMTDKDELGKYFELVLKFTRTFKGMIEEKAPNKFTISIEDIGKDVQVTDSRGRSVEADIIHDNDKESLLSSPNLGDIMKRCENKVFT